MNICSEGPFTPFPPWNYVCFSIQQSLMPIVGINTWLCYQVNFKQEKNMFRFIYQKEIIIFILDAI